MTKNTHLNMLRVETQTLACRGRPELFLSSSDFQEILISRDLAQVETRQNREDREITKQNGFNSLSAPAQHLDCCLNHSPVLGSLLVQWCKSKMKICVQIDNLLDQGGIASHCGFSLINWLPENELELQDWWRMLVLTEFLTFLDWSAQSCLEIISTNIYLTQ